MGKSCTWLSGFEMYVNKSHPLPKRKRYADKQEKATKNKCVDMDTHKRKHRQKKRWADQQTNIDRGREREREINDRKRADSRT